MDLVVIDVSNLDDMKVTGRIEDVFPYTIPKAENDQLPYAKIEKEKGVVIGWEIGREKRELETVPYPYYYDEMDASSSWSLNEGSSPIGGGSIGKSGSMARFGIYDNYLYAATNYQLCLFNVSTPAKPVKEGIQNLNGNIETMFIHDGYIFFGAPNGMMVYSLKIPSLPQHAGTYSHITSCDPVVVQDSIAYVTLRAGTACMGGVNRLDIIKMSHGYSEYELLASYSMSEPYGLGIDKDVLFVCDGKAGLKVIDPTQRDPSGDWIIAHFPEIQTYDVIPVNGYLFLIGNDGFYLYDYSDIKNIKQTGYIPVVKN